MEKDNNMDPPKLVSLEEQRRRRNREVLRKRNSPEDRIKHLEDTVERLIVRIDEMQNNIYAQKKLYYKILKKITDILKVK